MEPTAVEDEEKEQLFNVETYNNLEGIRSQISNMSQKV